MGEDGFFTNLGYLLSDQCPFSVKVARFKGEDKAVFQTRREMGGSVLKQVEDTLEMLDMLNDVHAEVGAAPERSEWRDYPPEALREAVLNAVVHRDYAIRASIGVNVFDGFCEILSPGGLPQETTWMAAWGCFRCAQREAGGSFLSPAMDRGVWYGHHENAAGICPYRSAEPDIQFLDGAVKVVLPNASGSNIGGSALRRQIDAAALAPVYCSESAKTVLEALSTEELLGKSDVARRTGMPPRKVASLLRNLVQDGLVEARGATRARVYRRRG